MGGKGKKMEKVQRPDGELVSFSLSFVTHIIEARMKEIFQLVQKEFKKIGKQGLLPAGVVFVGGGAKLPKLVDFAKKELKLPARIGIPHGVLVSEAKPEFLGVMGLVVSLGESEGLKEAGSRAGAWNKMRQVFKAFIP
jgi:cell division protein FtsA